MNNVYLYKKNQNKLVMNHLLNCELTYKMYGIFGSAIKKNCDVK